MEDMDEHEKQNTEGHLQQLTLKLANLDLYSIDIRREKQVIQKMHSTFEKYMSV